MAKTRKKKKARVPEVLWRIYRNKARTLFDTLVSLIPSNHSSQGCSCNPPSSYCLACCDDPRSFLIRPRDPKSYRTLMSRCFVVVPDVAPPLQSWISTRCLSQLQLVKMTIEVMLCKEPSSSNLLCSGYDKLASTSPAVELLTTSAWVILLDRVGDIVMHYLLRHTLIFVPEPQNSHFQVSGMSIGNLNLKKITEGTKDRLDKDQILLHCGARACKKRKRSDDTDLYSERPFHTDCMKMLRQPIPYEEHEPTSREGSTLTELSTAGNLKLHSGGGITESKKRTRQHRWQRRKKLSQSNLMGVCYNNFDAKSECHLAPGQCRCSFLFQAHMKITARTLIDRQPMFQRPDHSTTLFPRNHILNKLKPTLSGANQLLGEIFGAPSISDKYDKHTDCRTCSVDSACLHQSLIEKMKALIGRARKCKYLKLLNKHCPIQTMNSTTPNRTDSPSEIAGSAEFEKYIEPHQSGGPKPLHEQLNLCQMYCSKHQVASFIWAVCRSIIPQELLGTSLNWRTMRRNISIFLGLRRFEKFSLRQCLYKMKITAFCFFSDGTTSRHMRDQIPIRTKGKEGIQISVGNKGYKMRVGLLRCWVYWLFTNLVIPVVQCNFYVTTTQNGNQDIFYYRKSVWDKLTESAMNELKDQTLLCINVDSVKDIIGMRNFGFSKLRFLPKANGARTIANLSGCSWIPKQVYLENKQLTGRQKVGPCSQKLKFQYFKPVNSVLGDLHVVLKDVRRSEPEKLGSSVFDYNDVYKKLCPFLVSLKESSIMLPAYIVVTDVARAFDTINQEKLLSVMTNVMEHDQYHLKKTYEVLCTKKSMWVHTNILPKNQTILRCLSRSRPSVPYKLLHTVLVNQESSYPLQRKDLFRCLAEHVMGNILYLDGEFYLQKNGIAQGSILSSLLCSFYFAHLEKKIINPYLERSVYASNHTTLVPFSDASGQLGNDDASLPYPKYLLMRFIDDSILITTSRKQAISYCARLQRGFREYNCYINSSKWGMNFECDKISDYSNSRLLVGDDGISFLPWSGLLINCRTLEIQADYGRYLKNHLSSTLTINWHKKPYHDLVGKLRGFIIPKCHPILFDQNINSETVARLNVYQIFLLAAMKFHCYVQGLSRFLKPQPDFSHMVINSFRYLHTLIKKHMRRISSNSSIRPILTLERKEVKWLGLTAFIRALKRKQSRHRKLLSLLTSELKAHPFSKTMPEQLKLAVDDSHSSVLLKIRY